MSESLNSNYQVDCSEFTLKLNEFLHQNRERNVRSKPLIRIWIPNNNIESFVDTLNEVGFVSHSTEDYFWAWSKNAVIYFRVGQDGLESGKVFYNTETNIHDIVGMIENSSDSGKKLDIRWFTTARGDYEDISETVNEKSKDCIYPFIEGGIEQYIENFLYSKSSILILIGEPGTGKTNFIRTIISKMEKKIYLTFDESVLKSDGVFASFVSSRNCGAFVIEDADLLLKSRTEGNESMSKFLNVGDGIIKLNGKKLIFSTNLSSVNEMDDAIIRPGRCHDILKFRKLTLKEANVVCKEYDLDPLEENKDYTLTEIFNRRKVIKKGTIGFL